MTQQKTDPDLPMSVEESLVDVRVGGGWLRVEGTECSHGCMGPLEEGKNYLHYLHHSFTSGQITGREPQPHLLTGNWIKDLLSMTLPIRTRHSFTFRLIEASISLLSFSIRGSENYNHRKLTSDHMEQSCLTQ